MRFHFVLSGLYINLPNKAPVKYNGFVNIDTEDNVCDLGHF